MITKLQRPFDGLETEYKCLEYLKKIGSYIPPEEIEINCKAVLIGKQEGTVSIEKKITIQFIPLRKVLKKFFELPGIFRETMNYNDNLNKYNLLISNIIQADNWKLKKESFDGRLVLPMLLYQDDFETNNPLGTHRGIGKIGGVYIVIPCLPPSIQSKTENIFLLTLYKYSDQMNVSLHDIFAKAVEELQFLEQKGISISTSSGLVDVYFSLAGVIGDNLAVHTILGFMKSFSANFPCRVCLINNSEINSILKTSMCQLRTENNYLQHLTMNQPSLTGIAGTSVLSKLSSSTINLLTVDIMHDILEGICEYDLGLLLHHYIVTKKFFTCEDLNNNINGFYYGDEIRNKPREITMIQLKNKYIKMSASEMLCFLRNIGLLIGYYIPTDNQHWKIVIVLKEILDIITATVVHADLADYLESLIEEYLELLTLLFPECLKPKHHFLLHYAHIMRRMGPLCHLSTNRCESKNRDFKITSHVSGSRLNICKTLAIKSQLRLSCRILLHIPVNEKPYKSWLSKTVTAQELPDFYCYSMFLPIQLADTVSVLNFIKIKNHIIKKDVVLMLPNEREYQFFIVHLIIEDCSRNMYLITKEVTNYTYFDEH